MCHAKLKLNEWMCLSISRYTPRAYSCTNLINGSLDTTSKPITKTCLHTIRHSCRRSNKIIARQSNSGSQKSLLCQFLICCRHVELWTQARYMPCDMHFDWLYPWIAGPWGMLHVALLLREAAVSCLERHVVEPAGVNARLSHWRLISAGPSNSKVIEITVGGHGSQPKWSMKNYYIAYHISLRSEEYLVVLCASLRGYIPTAHSDYNNPYLNMEL